MTWQQLADEANAFADYLERRGEYAEVYRNKARMYARAQQAADLEDTTGVWHCVCCLKPRRDHGLQGLLRPRT